MTKLLKFLLLLMVFALLTACATTQPLNYNPGARVDTLSALVSVSVSKGEQGLSASGYLLYKRPDQMHLVILTPFGTTFMEVFLVGDKITIVETTKSIAYSGFIADLPEKGAGEIWRNARWMMDLDEPVKGVQYGTLERTTKTGIQEIVVFRNGLITSRRMKNGNEVTYDDYTALNGVPLATEIIMHSFSEGRFRLKISEPEVNGELSAEAFSPKLDGFISYPLAALQAKP